MTRPLGPLFYTLELQIQFLHFALVLHLLQVYLLVNFHFLRANLIDVGDDHNQHDHDEHQQRNKKR